MSINDEIAVTVIVEFQESLQRWHVFCPYSKIETFGDTREQALEIMKPNLRDRMKFYQNNGLEIFNLSL